MDSMTVDPVTEASGRGCEAAWAAAAAIRDMGEQLLADVPCTQLREAAMVHLSRAAGALEAER